MTPEELLSSNAVAVVSSSPAPWLDILQTQFWKSWDTGKCKTECNNWTHESIFYSKQRIANIATSTFLGRVAPNKLKMSRYFSLKWDIFSVWTFESFSMFYCENVLLLDLQIIKLFLFTVHTVATFLEFRLYMQTCFSSYTAKVNRHSRLQLCICNPVTCRAAVTSVTAYARSFILHH